MPISLILCLFVTSTITSAKPFCCERAKPSAASCPFCDLTIIRDADEIDNRVELDRGGKKTEYRCVLCALVDTKADRGNVIIVAPSEKKGKPVTLTRSAGAWSVDPDTAVFVYVKGSHAQCQVRYRAISSKAAFDAYLQTNSKVLASAKLISLADLIKRAE